MRFRRPAISGPLSRPVSASRSGWNSSRPFLPVDALTSSASAFHGSAVQSALSAATARLLHQQPLLVAELGRLDFAADDLKPG